MFHGGGGESKWRIRKEVSKEMWKMKEYIMSGSDEEERAESFLNEESEGL